MKKIFLTLSILSLSPTAFSQGIWASRDTLPDSAMVQGIPGFSINGYGYAGLGNYNHAIYNFDNLWRFDPGTNTWAQMAPFPGQARVAPACFVIGNKAYLVTGSVQNSGTCVTECWEYNASNNTWTQKASFPGSARTYAVGFAIGGKGYIGTGGNEYVDFEHDFYAYDTATDSWARIADFPGIARSCANGFSANGKGYVCFGRDTNYNLFKDMWEYDPVANSWTQKTSCPGSPIYCASGFAICNNIYVGSGVDTVGWTHTFWKYNTITDTWTQEASVPGTTKVQGAAFAINDTGYYGFGVDSMGVVHNIFDRLYAGDSCNITAGYTTIADVYEVKLYPNPNTGVFTVSYHAELVSASQPLIEIYNVLGEQVYNATLKQVQGDNSINITNQPNGVYLYRVINKDAAILLSGRLIIQK